jgi:hypothetical protein
MSKLTKPAFRSVEIDLIDKRLEAQAAEKGIPKLVSPVTTDVETAAGSQPRQNAESRQTKRQAKEQSATPRDRMVALNVEVPAYVWIELKTRAAQSMMSVKHFTLLALREQGIEIRDVDMVEDGRRMRGARVK